MRGTPRKQIPRGEKQAGYERHPQACDTPRRETGGV